MGIFIICHSPGVSDDQRRLFGLFRIDPIDDFVHLLSGIAGALVAWRWKTYIPAYFLLIGILYDLDAMVGVTMSCGLLDPPHIILATLALAIGVMKPGMRRARPSA